MTGGGRGEEDDEDEEDEKDEEEEDNMTRKITCSTSWLIMNL